MKFAILVIVCLVLAQSSPVLASSTPPAATEVSRNFTLERASFALAQRFTPFFQPGTKVRLDQIVKRLLTHLASSPENVDPYPVAQQEVLSNFSGLSQEHSDLLSFYVLAEVARILSVQGELKKRLDGLSELSTEVSLRLQRCMDKRSQFMSQLSNLMKKFASTQGAIVQNIK